MSETPPHGTDHLSQPISQARLDAITRELALTAEFYDRSAEFPQANFDLLAREGLIGLTVAREWGGRGEGIGEALRVLRAVAKGEPSTALILFMTYSHHAALARAWPKPVYERLAREAVAGHGLIGGLRVEPELGSSFRGGQPATTASRVPEGWRLRGCKIYATGSTGVNWFSVSAKTNEDTPRIGNFLVARDSPGVRIDPVWDHLGMRATVSHEIHFEDTLVPADYGPFADWAPLPGEKDLSFWNSLVISTIYDAVAQAARDWLRDYLRQRIPTNLGAALATVPRIQEKFGEIESLLQINHVMITEAAGRAERGGALSGSEANSIKHIVTGNAIRAVEIGLELTGNPGLSRRNPLERHYRDVLCSRIHSPQSDSILVTAGREALAT